MDILSRFNCLVEIKDIKSTKNKNYFFFFNWQSIRCYLFFHLANRVQLFGCQLLKKSLCESYNAHWKSTVQLSIVCTDQSEKVMLYWHTGVLWKRSCHDWWKEFSRFMIPWFDNILRSEINDYRTVLGHQE